MLLQITKESRQHSTIRSTTHQYILYLDFGEERHECRETKYRNQDGGSHPRTTEGHPQENENGDDQNRDCQKHTDQFGSKAQSFVGVVDNSWAVYAIWGTREGSFFGPKQKLLFG